MFGMQRQLRWFLAVAIIITGGILFIRFMLHAPVSKQAAARPIDEMRDGLFYISPESYLDTVGHLQKKNAVFLPAPQTESESDGTNGTVADFLGPDSCRDCHASYVDSAAMTAHFKTCRQASEDSLPAKAFFEPHNQLPTASADLRFEMSVVDGKYFQTAVLRRRGETFVHQKQIGLVTGSAKYGQTFLYWQNGCLYELPVSHFTDLNEWVNSPGYTDGSANFARPISARCLECHTTRFQQIGTPFNRFSEERSILGITCEKCHGPGRQHVSHHQQNPTDRDAKHIVNPGALDRDRSIDVCSQCHSGAGQPLRESFSFRPGDLLSEFVSIPADTTTGPGGVHSANQQARMALSACYKQSGEMQCTTCHDPHRQERGNAKLFIDRCRQCHESEDCRIVREVGATAEARCIDCHMPRRPDSEMPMQKQNDTFRPLLRDHLVDIWEDVTAEVLREIAAESKQQ